MERASQAIYVSLCMMLGLKSAGCADEKQQEAEDKQEPCLSQSPILMMQESFRVNLEPFHMESHASGPRFGEARRGEGGSCATCQLGDNVHEQ